MLFFFLAGGGPVAHRALHAKYPRRPRRGALLGGPFGRHAPRRRGYFAFGVFV